MNTPTGKSWAKRQTNQKFRRLFNDLRDVGSKISCRAVNRAHWGTGYSKKDLPKDKNME